MNHFVTCIDCGQSYPMEKTDAHRKPDGGWCPTVPGEREWCEVCSVNYAYGCEHHPNVVPAPTCEHCGKRASCFGRYERNDGPMEYACSDCCAHGNEDGHCVPADQAVAELQKQLALVDGWYEEELEGRGEAETALRQWKERAAELEAVLCYCRDNLEWEKKFRGNNYTLALEAIRVLLGDPGPEVGSRFQEVLAISQRAGK